MTRETNAPPELDILSAGGGPMWTPPNPADLPFIVTIPRIASGLYWPVLRVLRVSSRTMERPAARAALTTAVSDGRYAPSSATLQWVVDDRPYTCPPLAGCWTRTGSVRHGTGFIQLRWSLCTYRPQMCVNGWTWTWRRASIGPSREGPLEIDAEMESEGRAWAVTERIAYLPGLCSGRAVEPSHIAACHAARETT